jgi:hypothetical protein
MTAASEHTGSAGPGHLAAQDAQTTDRQADQRAQAARSVTCPCHARPGRPCTPAGDHLARYLYAEQTGAITRQSLTQVIAGLDVIAPHVLIQPPGEQAAHLAEERQRTMTQTTAPRHAGSVHRRLAGWIARLQQQLSSRLFADSDAFARQHDWTITRTTGRLGFGVRVYRDPRFDDRIGSYRQTKLTAANPLVIGRKDGT